MATIKQYLGSVRKKTGYDRLEARERLFLLLGITFVVCFLLFQGVVAPYLSAREKLERSLQRRQNDVLEMEILQQQYRELKQRQGEISQKVEQRDPTFSLFSFLEQQADAVMVKSRVTYMKPSTSDLEDGFKESAVEMKIEEITLGQLVNFLMKIESVDNVVVVKRLAIQNNKEEQDLLDVVVNIVTFEKSAEKS